MSAAMGSVHLAITLEYTHPGRPTAYLRLYAGDARSVVQTHAGAEVSRGQVDLFTDFGSNLSLANKNTAGGASPTNKPYGWPSIAVAKATYTGRRAFAPLRAESFGPRTLTTHM